MRKQAITTGQTRGKGHINRKPCDGEKELQCRGPRASSEFPHDDGDERQEDGHDRPVDPAGRSADSSDRGLREGDARRKRGKCRRSGRGGRV